VIGVLAKFGRAVAEYFGGGAQLAMGFEANDCLVFGAARRYCDHVRKRWRDWIYSIVHVLPEQIATKVQKILPMEQHEKITISEYQLTAASFREGTWGHDVSQNRAALIAALPNTPGKILDLGCGPGRDLVAFQGLGHSVTGLDATPAFVEMAKSAANCPVLEQSFLSLDLPADHFDGIFANASLIHVPTNEMLRVLKDLHKSLVDRGSLLMSMVRGDSEGFSDRPTGSRYVAGWEYDVLAPHLITAGFQILNHYYRPPGMPIEQQSWLVIVAQKVIQP
jgi:SAM-dependent methyltransferase